MPNSQIKKIDFINIDCDSNYFDTAEQIGLQNTYYFLDKSITSKVTGSNESVGHFSSRRIVKTRSTTISASLYPASSIVTDGSGNSRKILSSDIDIFASSSIDTYKNGVEILREKDWIAGLAKITAGNAGHLYQYNRFGIIEIGATDSLYIQNASSNDSSGAQRKYLMGEWTTTSQLDSSNASRKVYTSKKPSDFFIDTNKFDPVFFVSTGGNASLFSFPIVTNYSRTSESLVLNGIIEVLAIRPAKSRLFSSSPVTNAYTIRCQLGTGNANRRAASDFILSVDYFSPSVANKAVFLDSPGKISNSTDITGSFSAYSEEYSTGENYTLPFEDASYPRGYASSGSSYDGQMAAAVSAFDPSGATYVSRNQKSANCGFVFGDTQAGTDSIVFGDLSYTRTNRDNRRRKRNIISLRDSESFINKETLFNDTNTINFVSQSIEYPSMAPVNHNGPMFNSTVQSEIYKTGAIQVYISGSIKPGNFDVVLYDSIISSKKRLGNL